MCRDDGHIAFGPTTPPSSRSTYQKHSEEDQVHSYILHSAQIRSAYTTIPDTGPIHLPSVSSVRVRRHGNQKKNHPKLNSSLVPKGIFEIHPISVPELNNQKRPIVQDGSSTPPPGAFLVIEPTMVDQRALFFGGGGLLLSFGSRQNGCCLIKLHTKILVHRC